MSDDVLSIIPMDPQWQPTPEAADRAAAVIAELVPGTAEGVGVEVAIRWRERVTFIDCGENLERLGCPKCGESIDFPWWADLMAERWIDDFTDLSATVPCCGASTRLDEIVYEWPCGFARFGLEVRSPGRGLLTDEETAAVQAALGHEVRQIMAHL